MLLGLVPRFGEEKKLLYFLQLNNLSIPDHPRLAGETSFPFLRGGVGTALPGRGGGVCAVTSSGGKFLKEEQTQPLSEFGPSGEDT